MTYAHLPKLGTVSAPNLTWRATPNASERLHGVHPTEVWVHVWGGGSFPGVCDWLCDRKSEASAHVVYNGETGPHAGKATQLVEWHRKAWTECSFNDTGISVESGDAIWQGHDPEGFARLARLVALLCYLHEFPAHWVHGEMLLHGSRGFARHGDGLARGCGHLFCPTGDMALWGQFVERVTEESRRGGFRHTYGR